MNQVFACLYLSNQKKIELELFPAKAPKTVENFCKLAKAGFYTHSIFHRIIEDFMIQTGGYWIENHDTLKPLADTECIVGEFSQNGFAQNDLHHELGVISMARTNDKNSASGQFFLCSASDPWLDGAYAAFGKTVNKESNDAILELSHCQTTDIGSGFSDFPVDEISIDKVEIREN